MSNAVCDPCLAGETADRWTYINTKLELINEREDTVTPTDGKLKHSQTQGLLNGTAEHTGNT